MDSADMKNSEKLLKFWEPPRILMVSDSDGEVTGSVLWEGGSHGFILPLTEATVPRTPVIQNFEMTPAESRSNIFSRRRAIRRA